MVKMGSHNLCKVGVPVRVRLAPFGVEADRARLPKMPMYHIIAQNGDSHICYEVTLRVQDGIEFIGSYNTYEAALLAGKRADYVYNGNKSPEFNHWDDILDDAMANALDAQLVIKRKNQIYKAIDNHLSELLENKQMPPWDRNIEL